MTIRAIHEVKHYKNRFHKWLSENWSLVVILAVIVVLAISIMKGVRPIEEYFVKYEGATTLVTVKYGEKSAIFGYSEAAGFIEDNLYERYKNNELKEGKIEIYHPYSRGKSVMIDVSNIASIIKETYSDFYYEYSPRHYGGR